MAYYIVPPSGNAVPLSKLLAPAAGDFVRDFAARKGLPAGNVFMTASGASALWLALRALRALEPRRRAVAVPAWCCPSVPQAVIQAGLEPVPVDLDPHTLGYVTEELQAAGARGLLAVVLVHFFGLPMPLPEGDFDGAVFLRDCAQDFEHAPADGLACFYSFGRGKALNAGHGGALCLPSGPWRDACGRLLGTLPVSREKIRPKVIAINLLSEPHVYWLLSRLPLGLGKTEWHPLSPEGVSGDFMAVAPACLEAYEGNREYYGRLVAGYRDLFAGCDVRRLAVPEGAPAGWLPARFPVLVRDAGLRGTLFAEMNDRFGGVTRMYPAALPALPGAPAGFGGDRAFPGAARVAGEILTFPVTAELKGREGEMLAALAEILVREGALAAPAAAGIPEAETEDWTPAFS